MSEQQIIAEKPQRFSFADLTPEEMVARMFATTARLIEIVDQETAAIQNHRPQDIFELQAEKASLASSYAMGVQEISSRTAEIDRVPLEPLKTLKNAVAHLHKQLELNANALQAAASVSQGLIQAVAESMAERYNPTTGYGKNATMTKPSVPATGSIALDSRA